MKFKEKIKTFFTTGIFEKGKFPLRFIIALCLFICSFSTFYIALTATCTDPELATIRTMYEYGEEEIALAPTETYWSYKNLGFDTSTRYTFTERQKEMLKEYAGDNLVIEVKQILLHHEVATFKLSGDLRKDKTLLNNLRYLDKILYGVLVISNNSYYNAAFYGTHIGAGLDGWEIILLFVTSLITFCIAVSQMKKFCAKKFSPVLKEDLEFYSSNKKTPLKTTVMLQGLFLAAILFLIAVCISHAAFMGINMRPHQGAWDGIILMKRAVIPEPISSVIFSVVCFLTLFLIPLSSYKKQLKILKQST